MTGPPRDPWVALAARTPARIALGRTGASLPTREVLALALAHARARDAVWTPLDAAPLIDGLAALGLSPIEVASEAADRATYLRRPDHGRRLNAASRAALERIADAPCDLALVIADGLSAAAVHAHAVPLVAALLPLIASLGLTLTPAVVATQARVALGDEVGSRLGARLVAVLIGERPGLSAPDSLGVYLTCNPSPGRTDAERNCLSNVRAAGLSYDQAAFKLAWLVREALRRGETGVRLKDESDRALAGPNAPLLTRG